MTENVPGDAFDSLFFGTAEPRPSESLAAVEGVDPLVGPAGLALDAVAMRGMSDGALRQEIIMMLACLQRRPVAEAAAGPLHRDGTLALDSMTAVWVIATIGKAFGSKLVKLSGVDRESLRSVGALASLVRSAIARPEFLAGAA